MTYTMLDFGMLDEGPTPIPAALPVAEALPEPPAAGEVMLDFDFTVEAPVQPSQRVTVAPVGSVSSAHVLKTESSEWTWEDLRNYVISEAERRFGPQLRDPAKESGIFKSFIKRYGADAVVIAQAAFLIYNGMWNSAPITPTRFCKASDEYFADVILARVKG